MEIHFSQILIQIINFGILVFVLKKALYAQILKIISQRAAKIKSGLDAAEKNIQREKELELEREKVIEQAQSEAAKIMEEATKKAKKMKKDLMDKAKEEALEEAKKEKEKLKIALAGQEKEMKKDISKLVMVTAEAVLKDKLSAAAHKDIIDNQIKKLKNVKPAVSIA